MNSELLAHLQAAQSTLEPQYQALHAAVAALKRAAVLASDEPLDAIAMHKHLAKLEEAAARLDDPTLAAAVAGFAQQTQHGLDALAFEFARDLKHVFEQRGQAVEGRPPTLVVDSLALHIDMGARKAQWLYGKEALTSPIALSINAIVKPTTNRPRPSCSAASTYRPSWPSSTGHGRTSLASARRLRPASASTLSRSTAR